MDVAGRHVARDRHGTHRSVQDHARRAVARGTAVVDGAKQDIPSTAPGILAEGLRGGTCWGTVEMAAHFARVECKENGGRPKVVARRLSAFDLANLEPDEQAVDFPMTDLFGSSHDVLGCEWEESAQGWEECLRLYRSVV